MLGLVLPATALFLGLYSGEPASAQSQPPAPKASSPAPSPPPNATKPPATASVPPEMLAPALTSPPEATKPVAAASILPEMLPPAPPSPPQASKPVAAASVPPRTVAPTPPPPPKATKSPDTLPPPKSSQSPPASVISAQVIVDKLPVHDGADESSYQSGSLERGDRIRVHGRIADTWLAIDPPSSAICWIERAAIQWENDSPAPAKSPAASSSSIPHRARVTAQQAIVRSGHPDAKLPGPPISTVEKGTMVTLVDRPPLTIGQGAGATVWYAMAPPDGQTRYVSAAGTNWSNPATKADRTPQSPVPNQPVQETASTPSAAISSTGLPAEVTAELAAIQSMHRSVLVNLPIEEWKFDNVRARYQTLLKQAGANPAVEAELRSRLAQLTKQEQAAQAARTVASILSQSRRRDRVVAAIDSRLARTESSQAHTYTARGFVQPSSNMHNGHKVFALIGPTGSTVAYLDIPPGLDVNAHFSHRVGVRGVMHYNEDLGARLITVRDIEPLGSARR